MTYALPSSPSVGLEDLPSLIRWFLNHDRHTPNNLEILEEAYRIRYGAEDNRTYERHLAWTIADDLCSYNSADLLQEHLILLTTIYARTLQALRRLGPHQIDPRSSDASRNQTGRRCGNCVCDSVSPLPGSGWRAGFTSYNTMSPRTSRKSILSAAHECGLREEIRARASHK